MSNQTRIGAAFVLVDACWLVLIRARGDAARAVQPTESALRLADELHRAECVRALDKVAIDETLAGRVLGLDGSNDGKTTDGPQANNIDPAFAGRAQGQKTGEIQRPTDVL